MDQLIITHLKGVLEDHHLLTAVDEAEESGDVWFCYTIASAQMGQYQYEAICEFFDQPIPEGEDVDYVWDDIDRWSSDYADELNSLDLDVPEGCSFCLGHWEGGGCYGIILHIDIE